MTQSKFTTINSRLYSELFSLGGDSLVSVYAILKASKNKEVKIYKEGNRNIYHTLKFDNKYTLILTQSGTNRVGVSIRKRVTETENNLILNGQVIRQ